MVLITNNWRLWGLGMLSSLVIFAVLYFTVIKPDNNAANQALKSGLQQSQQVIRQSQKELNNSGAPSGVTKKAKHELGAAAKLTACVQAAGTDTSKLASCQAKFGH
jgi:hypothetical protein